MSNTEKIKDMLKNDPTLTDQLKAEAHRLAEAGNKDILDISAKSIKAVFGVDLTDEELKQVTTENTELSPEEMEKVSGGFSINEFLMKVVLWHVVTSNMPSGDIDSDGREPIPELEALV